MALKPRQAIVHFGMPKTGTSSIQVSLFRNLSDPGFYYVNLGGPNASTGIATAFKANPERFHFHAHSGTSDDELGRLRKKTTEKLGAELQSAGTKSAILSGEAVSGLKESEFADLCGVLAMHCATVTAVGYVRRPKEYMESTFQQRVKAGVPDFDMSKLFPNYRRRFEKFDTVLGTEHTRMWLFDPTSFPDQCVVGDFCARLGIAFRAEDVDRVNEGLSLPALSLLFAYWKFGPGYGVGPAVIEENRRLARQIRNLSGPKLRLHSTLVAPVIERRRADVDWMETRLGASLREDLAAHDADAVRSEDDLLKFTPEALQWLAGELGGDFARHCRPGVSPQKVAEGMHLLRAKLAGTEQKPKAPVVSQMRANIPIDQAGQGDREMNINELVRSARQSATKLEQLSDEDAQRLVREVFGQIRRKIEATHEGEVEIGGLGLFRIKQGEREKEGRKIPVKRVVFRSEKTGATAK